MSLSPDMESPVDAGGINEVRMNLNEDFLNACEDKKEAETVNSENMPVFVRMRPLLPQENVLGYDDCLTIVEKNTIRAIAPADSAKYKNATSAQEKIQDFTFSHAFGPNVNHFTFFEETMNNTVKNFIEGQNALIFAYGSSGSGKTYTMLGNETDPGIIPLSVQLLFQCIQGKQLDIVSFKPYKACEIAYLDGAELSTQCAEKEKLLQLSQNEDNEISKMSSLSMGSIDDVNQISSSLLSLNDLSSCPSFAQLESSCRSFLEFQGDYFYSVWVSFVELYNEQIFDLLQPFTKKKRPALSLGEDNSGNIFVKGLKEINVCSSDEVLKLLRLGKRNLKIATTKLNYQSSRSHCIFSVKVIRTADAKNSSKVWVNSLSFCDLAGSERCGKTQNTGVRLKEASNINTSLMILGRCIEILRQNQTQREKKLIPFRESKLTRLFSNFFIGKGKASMIVNVSPSSHTFDETLNVLKFSALAQQITIKACALSKELSRLTELLSCDRQSTGSGRESMDEELDYSVALDEREGMIKELIEIAQKLESELNKERHEKAKMETEIRAKVKQEYDEYVVEIQKQNYKRIEEVRKIYANRAEKRTKEILFSIDAKPPDSEEEEDEIDDDDVVELDVLDVCEATSSTSEASVVETKEEPTRLEENTLNETKELLKSKSEVVKLESKNREMQERIDSLEKLLQDKNEKENVRSNEIKSNLESTIAELQQKITQLECELKEKEKELKQACDSVVEHSENCAALNEKIMSLENVICAKDEDLTEKEALLKEAEVSLASKSDDLSVYEQKLSALQDTISAKDQKLEEVSSLLMAAETSLKAKSEELAEAQKQVTSFKEAICSKDNALKENEELLVSKIEEISELEKNIIELENLISSKDVELKEKKSELKKSEALLASKMRDLSSAEQRIVKLQETIFAKDQSDVASSLISKTEELQAMEAKVIELQEILQSKEKELAEVKGLLKENNVTLVMNAGEPSQMEPNDNTNELRRNLRGKRSTLPSKEEEHGQFKQKITKLRKGSRSRSEGIFMEGYESEDSVSKELADARKKVAELQTTVNMKDSLLASMELCLKEREENIVLKIRALSQQQQTISELNSIIHSKDEQLGKNASRVSALEVSEVEDESLMDGYVSCQEEQLQKNKIDQKSKTSVPALQANISKADKQTETSNVCMADSIQELAETQNKLKTVQESYDVVAAKLKETDDTLALKISEILALNQKITSYEFDIITKEKLLKSTTKELRTTEAALNDKLKIIEEKEKEITRLLDAAAAQKQEKIEQDEILSKTADVLLEKEAKITDLESEVLQLKTLKTSERMKVSPAKNKKSDGTPVLSSPKTSLSPKVKGHTATHGEISESELSVDFVNHLLSLSGVLQQIENIATKSRLTLEDKNAALKKLHACVPKDESFEKSSSVVPFNEEVPESPKKVMEISAKKKMVRKISCDEKIMEISDDEKVICKISNDKKMLMKVDDDEKMIAKVYDDESMIKISDYENLVIMLQKIECKASENSKHWIAENVAMKAQMQEQHKTLESRNIVKNQVVQEQAFLLELVQRTECAAMEKSQQLLLINKEKSLEVKKLCQKLSNVISQQAEVNVKVIDMERLLQEKESSIKDLEKALMDLKHIQDEERSSCKQKHEAEIKEAMKQKKSLEEENKHLKAEANQKETKENLSDADFEPKRMLRKRTAYSNASQSREMPKRTTRVSRQKNVTRSQGDDDDDDIQIINNPTEESHTQEASFPKKNLDATYSVSTSESNQVVPPSPLDKIRNFVTVAVPKIRTAAQHVSSYLSPVVKKQTSDSTLVNRKKRKLFTDKDQPVLAEISPVEIKKGKEPAEKRTRSARQAKKQCR